MPRVSARQDTLKWVRKNLYLSILMDSSDSDDLGDSSDGRSSESSGFCSPLMSVSDDCLDSSSDSEAGNLHDPMDVDIKPGEWFELHTLLESERYWSERTKRYQSKQFSETFFYESIPDHLFRQMTRMGKEPFKQLVSTIEDHWVFQNRALKPQAPVTLQLAICLDRMGHSGNGSCLKHTLLLWGISMGSCCNYTRRTMEALEDCIGDVLKWPDAANRNLIADEFAKKGFPGCVGLIDGTTIPLAQKPAQSGEVYFDRKSRYSINAQVVCDDNRKITFIYSGPPGSCSDITCLKRSALWDRIHGTSMFDPGQYLLSDSGYVNAPHLVCAYRMTMNNADREAFNFCIAKTRVINEHTIGVLKMRWFSLKELRIQLNKQEDHVRMCKWIITCALLHNYVHECNDPWTDEDMEFCPLEPVVEIPLDPGQSRGRSRQSMAAGARLLERVKAHTLHFNRQPGGVYGVRRAVFIWWTALLSFTLQVQRETLLNTTEHKVCLQGKFRSEDMLTENEGLFRSEVDKTRGSISIADFKRFFHSLHNR